MPVICGSPLFHVNVNLPAICSLLLPIKVSDFTPSTARLNLISEDTFLKWNLSPSAFATTTAQLFDIDPILAFC